MRNVSEKVVEKIKTHSLCSVNSFSENNAIQEIMWKNMVQPDISQIEILYSAEEMKESRHTHIIFITVCFSTAAVVILKHSNVTLYVHCLSCYPLRSEL
jgi:hypothetical protein